MKSREELKQEILDKLNLIRPFTTEDEKKRLREEINDIITEYFEEEECEFSMGLILDGVFYILFFLKLFNIVDISLWTVALPLIVYTTYELIGKLRKHLNK